MTAIVLRNSREIDGPVKPPRRDDGSQYPHAMYAADWSMVVFGDTLSDLVSALLGSYRSEDAEEQLRQRSEYAAEVAALIQAAVLVSTDLSALSDEELEVLNMPRDPLGTPRIDSWDSEVPLILVRTSYGPYTDTPRPIGDRTLGNIVWLRPSTEIEFLQSLDAVGYIELFGSADSHA